MLSLLEDRVSLVIDAENLKKNTSKTIIYMKTILPLK